MIYDQASLKYTNLRDIMNIPDATLPDLPPGTKLNFKTLREWLEELLYRIISKIGGGVGKPDLVNETLNLIYDIKSGDLDAAGRSDWPNDVTVGKGFGQVLWYFFWASLAKGHPIYDNGKGSWKPGDLENDKPLANALTKCGGVCNSWRSWCRTADCLWRSWRPGLSCRRHRSTKGISNSQICGIVQQAVGGDPTNYQNVACTYSSSSCGGSKRIFGRWRLPSGLGG
jgi:hypothetical protein